MPLIETAVQAVKEVIPLEEAVSSFVPAEIADLVPGVTNPTEIVTQAMKDPINAVKSMNPMSLFDPEIKEDVNLSDLEITDSSIVKPSKRSLRREKRSAPVKIQANLPRELLPTDNTGVSYTNNIFEHRKVARHNPELSAKKRIAKSRRVLTLLTRKDIVEKSLSTANLFLDLKISIFEYQVQFITNLVGRGGVWTFDPKHLKSAKLNLNKLYHLRGMLDQYALLISDGSDAEVSRQTLSVLKKFASSVSAIHTEKKFSFKVARDVKFDHFKDRINLALKDCFPTQSEKKAYYKCLRNLVGKWLTDEQLKAFEYFDGIMTLDVHQSNNESMKPSNRRFNPNKASTASLKILSKESTKVGSQAASALNSRIKNFRNVSAPRVKKGDEKSYDQGLVDWVINKISPPKVMDMVYHLSGPTKFFEWLQHNLYYKPAQEEIDYFNVAFMDRTYFDKRLNEFKADVPKSVLVKWINQNIFCSEIFVLYDNKEYRRSENPKKYGFDAPAPRELLNRIYEKACNILSTFGGATVVALDFFKSTFETIMGWLKKFTKIAVICADFMYQLLYNFIILICNKFGVCLPAIDVTHGSTDYSSELSDMTNGLLSTNNTKSGDIATSSDQDGFSGLSVTRFLKNIFGPFSNVLDESLDEKSFIHELKNAATTFSFLNVGMSFITRVANLIIQFVSFLVKKVVGDPKAEFLKKCDSMILQVQGATNVDLTFAKEYLHYYNSLVLQSTKFDSKDVLSGAYFRTRRDMHSHVNMIRQIVNSSDKRNQPMAIHIVGAAGLGKTTLVPFITRTLMGTDIKQNDADTYVWDPTGFQDGYNAQSIVVINDIFNEQDDQYDIRMCSDLLHIVSNDYWPVPVASPEKKGANPLRAQIVVTTSNCVIFPAKAALRDANAYKRRRSVVVEMMKASKSVMNEPNHAYDKYIFVVKNIFDEANTSYWVPMDFKSFMRYLMIVKRDVVDRKFVDYKDKDDDIVVSSFEESLSSPTFNANHVIINHEIANIWEMTTKCNPTGTIDHTIRTSVEAQKLADEFCNFDQKSGITTRNMSQSVDTADKLIGMVVVDAFKGENLPVVKAELDPYVSEYFPYNHWHKFCDAIYSNRNIITKITLGVSLGLVGFATILGIKSLIIPKFDKADDQNASGLTTVHAQRNTVKVLKRPLPKPRDLSSDQGESDYVHKLGNSICSATIALKNDLVAHFQMVFLDNQYLITNAHSLARVQSAKEDGSLSTWYVTRCNGMVVPLDSVDFSKDIVKEDGTDLVFMRLPRKLLSLTTGQKSIISHFVKNVGDIRPDFWNFETIRKRGSAEMNPAIIHAIRRMRVMNISMEDGRVYTDHLRGSVESAPGYCGSLLVGGPCRFILGMHVSGDSANADFVPIDMNLIMHFIRSEFDANFMLVKTDVVEHLPVDVDDYSVTQAVDQTEGDEVAITEYERITVFRLLGQPSQELLPSWRTQSQRLPQLDCSDTPMRKVSPMIHTKWQWPKSETISPVLRIMLFLKSSISFWSVTLALILGMLLIWIHALMVLLVKYLLWNTTPQAGVSSVMVFGTALPAPTMFTVTLTIFCNLSLSFLNLCLTLLKMDCLVLMSPIASRTNVCPSKKRELPKQNFSLLCPSPSLFTCVVILFLCYFIFVKSDWSLEWLLGSTPIVQIFMSFMNILTLFPTLLL